MTAFFALRRAFSSFIKALTDSSFSKLHTASRTFFCAARDSTGPASAANFSSISASDKGFRGSPLG